MTPRFRRLRGSLAGAVGLATVSLLLSAALDLGWPGIGPGGTLVVGLRSEVLAFLALAVAAMAGGAVSSVGAGDYVSGTSVLAVSSGLVLAWLLRFGFGHQSLLAAEAGPFELAVDVVAGLVLILTGYIAAWQTDLRWILPRRHGPAYVQKRVGAREMVTVNLPAMAITVAAPLALQSLLVRFTSTGPAAALVWLALCVLAAALARELFPVRSTFFLWVGPSVGVLAVLTAAPGSDPAGWIHVPFGLLAPLGALGAALGSVLATRTRGRSQRLPGTG